MSDENVPMDATAMYAEEIVKAAIAWRWAMDADPVLTRAEWRLHEATGNYGSEFKGLRSQ